MGRSRLDVGASNLTQIVDQLERFLPPPLAAAGSEEKFASVWPPGDPWAIQASD